MAAGLLVLAGLGLFLAGVLTGTTVFYWACVGVCVVAAVLLFAARRGISRAEAALSATRVRGTTSSPPVSAAAAGQPAPTATGGATAASSGPASSAASPEPASPEVVAPEVVAPEVGPPVRAHREPTPSAGHSSSPSDVAPADLHDPPIEDVEVTDLLLIVDLEDEVLVVDEHPRYHLEGCRFLVGRTAIPLPLDEARTDGFTPCALCTPDRHLADRQRARR
jgi:hypothetical protein